MELFTLKPHGEISEESDWGTKEHTYETGAKQYQQKYTEADVTWNMKFSGTAKDLRYLQDFFNARRAQIEKFKMVINEQEEVVRFSTSKLAPKIYRECGKIKGFECDVSVRRVKEN